MYEDFCVHECVGLVGVMQFQFVVNEMLHDMQAGEPLISDKYDTLWETPCVRFCAGTEIA